MEVKRGPGRPKADRSEQERKRRPMSIPRRKMEVSERPGYHRHWLNDTGGRIQQALDAGYRFVGKDDVELNEISVVPGNSDLGSMTSMIVGSDEYGKGIVAFLMEIKQEWYDEDQKVIAERNDLVDKAIRSGQIGMDAENASDRGRRYNKDVDYRPNFRGDPRR